MSTSIHMTFEQERRARRSLLDRWQAARERGAAQLGDEGACTRLREANADHLAADQSAALFLGVLSANAPELESIVHALRRLRSGVYGRCIACTEPIGTSALEAAPETALCNPCATNRSAL